jgi:hypothetical protein
VPHDHDFKAFCTDPKGASIPEIEHCSWAPVDSLRFSLKCFPYSIYLLVYLLPVSPLGSICAWPELKEGDTRCAWSSICGLSQLDLAHPSQSPTPPRPYSLACLLFEETTAPGLCKRWMASVTGPMWASMDCQVGKSSSKQAVHYELIIAPGITCSVTDWESDR